MGYLDLLNRNKQKLPDPDSALPGRTTPMAVAPKHFVLGTSMIPPFPEGMSVIYVGMGCFWGAEKVFWSLPGVYTTAVGYGAGITPNPTYEEVCSGQTGHNELVMVAYEESKLPLQELLKVFWQSHNPTEGMRQGNDIGTQYRSGIYFGELGSDLDKLEQAKQSQQHYDQLLSESKKPKSTTEIRSDITFYFAEDYHQQYLAKNPQGYCPNHTCSATGLPQFG